MHEVRGTTSELRNQRGAGLVVAMLVLLFITLLAAALMQNITVEDRITGETMRGSTALNIAESGVAEAIERIRLGEIPDDGDPRMVAQIYLTAPGRAPACGPDTIALSTWQTPPMLEYSAATKSPDVLTIRYKTDATHDRIYRYDAERNPRIQTMSGEPIFVITSTGRVGASARTVVSEVIRAPISVSSFAALAGKRGVVNLQQLYVCGFDHDRETPLWTASAHGRDGESGACNENLAVQHWELPGNVLPGVWTQGKFQSKQGAPSGSPAVVENAMGFPSIWTMLNLTPGDFNTVVGKPLDADVAGSLHGARYYKPASGTLVITGGNGDGLLYVEGNVQIKGTFTYQGLIYSTGGIDIMGRAWILGGVVAGGSVRCLQSRQSVTVLYSRDAVNECVSRYSGRFVTLAWRELQSAPAPAPGTVGS